MSKPSLVLLVALLGCGGGKSRVDAATGVGGAAGGGAGSAGEGGTSPCAGSAGFKCVVGSCDNDIVMQVTCSNGNWTCPGGSVQCSGCFGLPPPGYVCGDGGWTQGDGGSEN